jgi:hypothetical protein
MTDKGCNAVKRGTLLPDPRYDAVRCVVLAAADDAEDMSSGTCATRVLLLDDKGKRPLDGLPNVQASALMPLSIFSSHEPLAYSILTARNNFAIQHSLEDGTFAFLQQRCG